MAIIDPDGLFSGERLAACSDVAQLYWPRLFLAANSCCRIELSYKSIVSRIFANFHTPPEVSEIWDVFREYEKNFLAVIYETEGGVWWCQFITSEKFLPKYKKTRDKSSPAPTVEMMERHRLGYIEWKRANSFQNQSFQKTDESFQRRGIGIGVGIGVGIGEEQLQKPSGKKPSHKAKAPDPRHSPFRESLEKYWAKKNPSGPPMPWGPAEAKQMAMMLSANPAMTLEEFRELLRNRAKSDVAHGDPVRAWIGSITKFTQPLDRYGKPVQNGGTNATVHAGKMEENMGVLAGSLGPRQREDTVDEDGVLPADEDRQVHTGAIQPLLNPFGPESVSGGHGATGRKSKGRGANGFPFDG